MDSNATKSDLISNSIKLYGWHKATSAEQYREMIEAEYYRLRAEKGDEPNRSVGLEEVKLRLFLSLLEKPAVGTKGASKAQPHLLHNDQAAPDQIA